MYPARSLPPQRALSIYIYMYVRVSLSLAQPYILHKQKEPCSSHPPTHPLPPPPTHPPTFLLRPVSIFLLPIFQCGSSRKSYGFPKPRRLPSFRIKCRGYKYQLRAARLYFISVSARAVRMSCLLLPSRFYSPTFLFVGRAKSTSLKENWRWLPAHIPHTHTHTDMAHHAKVRNGLRLYPMPPGLFL
jgi:hypothetical protein